MHAEFGYTESKSRCKSKYKKSFHLEGVLLEKDIQKVTDDAVKHIDEMTANKEKELLEV